MQQDDLNYFKNIIEGKTNMTWKYFWKKNSERLKKELPKREFTKLKFGKLNRASEILTELDIEFKWTKKADYHQAISNFSDDFCDHLGYPILSTQRQLYNGAVGDFLDGNTDTAKLKLNTYIKEIESIKDEILQSEKINDLEYDASSFINQGQPEIGIEILKLIVNRFNNFNDLTQPAVNFAKEKLKTISQ